MRQEGPQDERQESRRSQTTRKSKDCPLDVKKLPIVGEAEHRSGYCFCHHCTCSKHVCPSKGLTQKSSGFYRTSYSVDYSRPKAFPIPEQIRAENSIAIGDHKLLDKSVHQTDYQPPPKTKSYRKLPESPIVSPCFLSSSMYKREFVDWKSGTPFINQEPIYPHRGDMLKFNASSTYNSSFTRPNTCLKRINTPSKQGPFMKYDKSLFFPTSYTQFTNKFTEAQSLNASKKVKKEGKSEKIVNPIYSKSTYQSEFTKKSSYVELSRKRNK